MIPAERGLSTYAEPVGREDDGRTREGWSRKASYDAGFGHFEVGAIHERKAECISGWCSASVMKRERNRATVNTMNDEETVRIGR